MLTVAVPGVFVLLARVGVVRAPPRGVGPVALVAGPGLVQLRGAATCQRLHEASLRLAHLRVGSGRPDTSPPLGLISSTQEPPCVRNVAIQRIAWDGTKIELDSAGPV